MLVWGKNELCKPPKNVNKLLFLAVGNLSVFFSLICQRQYWVKVSSGSCMFRAGRDSIVCSQGPELTSIRLLLLIAPLGRDCLHAHSIRVLLMYPYISVDLVLLPVLAALFCWGCFFVFFFVNVFAPVSHDQFSSVVLVCFRNGFTLHSLS